MSNIVKTTLGSILEFQRGYDLPKSQFVTGLYPVVSSNGILGYHNEFRAKGPGVTIGRSGTVGIPHFYEFDFFPHNTTLFVKDFKGNDPKYIYYLLKTLRLNNRKSGSGVPTMNRNHLHPIDVYAHLDVKVQHKISSILSTLDSKIEVNNKINANIEILITSIFENWFIQYDFPDEQGRPYKSSGGTMVWSEELKCEYPRDWLVDALEKYITFDRGISYTTKDIESGHGVPMINLASIDIHRNYKPNELKFYSGKFDDNKLVKFGDMLVACTDLTRNADIIGSPIIVPKEYDKYLYSMDLAKVNILSDEIVDLYLYMTLRTKFYHHYIKYFASGTNVLHLNLDGIGWYPCVIPPIKIQQNFAKAIKKLIHMQTVVINENNALTSLRDWLLPMLMNGQIKVSD